MWNAESEAAKCGFEYGRILMEVEEKHFEKIETDESEFKVCKPWKRKWNPESKAVRF